LLVVGLELEGGACAFAIVTSTDNESMLSTITENKIHLALLVSGFLIAHLLYAFREQ
jgi:hypothetical protein